MARLLAFVEGATEERFVKQLLAPWLGVKGVHVTATTPGIKRQQGGVQPWNRAQKDLVSFLKEDAGRYVTTMFDYYRMPLDWPGRQAASGQPCAAKSSTVEEAILADVSAAIGHVFNPHQFIPYVQMHEFEALLFSDPPALGAFLPVQNAGQLLQVVANAFSAPEQINDGPSSSPSQRIRKIYPGYQKVIDGNLAAERIGLPAMRKACPHFDAWVTKLDAL